MDSGVIDGDFNDDGLWNAIDIDQLVADIVGPGTPASYDLTGDGLVDLADRDAWLAEAGGINLASGNPYLLGDLDLNGDVDGLDFIGWNNNKFTPAAAWSSGDFNADGFVDGLDFTIWNDNKFTSADAPTSGVAGTIDSDPFGDAPFWPLGHDGHDHDDGHDHGDFLTDVFPENFDFSMELTVVGVNAAGTVHSQIDLVQTTTPRKRPRMPSPEDYRKPVAHRSRRLPRRVRCSAPADVWLRWTSIKRFG